jgi:NADH:ubiquinone oxidoreductase subunit 4 (subunit M)
MLILAFSTIDLFIFYLSFEGLSIPVFFLIYLYGAEVTKIRASLYFIIYSFLSSTCMAVSIFLLYSQFNTTNINQLIISYKPICLIQQESSINLFNDFYLQELYNFNQNLMSFERLSLI